MKKIISLLMALVVIVSASFGQANPAPKKVVTTHKQVSTTTKVHNPAVKVTSTTTVTKKDGTPDKRYKANKVETSKTVVLKKDGTPDKRYKKTDKKS